MTIRTKLAQAYRILGLLRLDDHTYTHLSARAEDGQSFYIYPFGLRFEEVTPECLLRVRFNGDIIEGTEAQYNRTGYVIHGAVYQARPDLQAAFHLHTPATVAVSALEEGLMPLSQWALHFYNQVAYHTYDSLALDQNQGETLARDLGDKNVMLLRHHGSLTCGKTIEEALFYTHHLELACHTQCLTLAMNRAIIRLSDATCTKAVHDLLNFEENLGYRDWQAWLRMLERKEKRNSNDYSSSDSQGCTPHRPDPRSVVAGKLPRCPGS